MGEEKDPSELCSLKSGAEQCVNGFWPCATRNAAYASTVSPGVDFRLMWIFFVRREKHEVLCGVDATKIASGRSCGANTLLDDTRLAVSLDRDLRKIQPISEGKLASQSHWNDTADPLCD
jgi:hypothetical protein